MTRHPVRSLAAVVVAAAVVLGVASPSLAATGVDVASWQHPGGAAIDWAAVRGAGHTFAFIKADEGPWSGRPNFYTNPYFADDWVGAGAVGMYRGAYHYAQPKVPASTAVDDARHMISVTGTMRGPRDLPPVLDLEEHRDLPAADIVAWARTWLEEVERLTGRKPIIYTGRYYWNTHLAGTTELSGYPLWIASWYETLTPTTNPALMGGWQTWTFWQHTATGSSPGIQGNVDLNRYCCADENLAALANGAAGDQAGSNPFGRLDTATASGSELRVTGWAIDPDTRSPLDVHLYVDGTGAPPTVADHPRPDVSTAYPGWAGPHGFDVTLPMTRGPHRVCAYALNVGPGSSNTELGCRDVVVPSGPIGFRDVQGWTPFVEDISWLAGNGIAEGYADGSFRPPEPITRQAMAAFLHRYADLVGGVPTGPAPTFTDVPADHPFAADIAWLASTGVAEGYADGSFQPTAPISRQAMAAFLHRLRAALDGQAPTPGSASFSDVPGDHPFAAEIAWLASAGVAQGYGDGRFQPGAPVSRQAMAAFLHRFDALG